ncbi:heterokaryon incompatibility het-6 protein [Rutstroemia sp. NJR-2017a BVV2]|nr:heterokaryon incompatibility het-6 protein [Rutstroemia sp. NJR-2017a BVV2]
MDDVTCKYDPECILDDIIANCEQDVLIFQPPRDISSGEELNLHSQNRLLEYQYRELQHARNIRLLEHSGRLDSNDVRFHLSEHSLQRVDGEFIAISYCWGRETPTKPLPISSSAYLKVTKTVDSLLKHVAGVASGLPVWVDAICINQDDIKEKNNQVSMMRDIYAAAKCVLVWLGNEDLTRTDELVLFQYLATAGGEEGKKLMGQVLQSPWFERSWVIQEVCFARKAFFLCGSVGISLPYLEKVLDTAQKNYSSLPDSYSIPSDWGPMFLPVFKQFRRLRGLRDRIQENNGQPHLPLTDILLDFKSSKATDPRDKVFAFLGLADHHNLKPDYEDSIGNVFVKAMVSCCPSLYDYRILGYAGLANPRINEQTMFGPVPTWVPDFSRTFLVAPFTMGTDFKATLPKDLEEAALESWSGKPQLVWRKPQALDLFIKTAFIDTIDEMSVSGLCTVDSPFSNKQDYLKRQKEIAREGIEMLKRRKLYPDSEGPSVICLETLSTGGFHNDNGISKLKTAAFEAFLELRGAPIFLPHSQASGEIRKMFARIYESGIGLSRRLFTTKGGYLGVANNDIRKGDRVCLIDGAPVPFILRGPVAIHDKPTIYNLVCDAYVHGVMYGEASNTCGRFETILLE